MTPETPEVTIYADGSAQTNPSVELARPASNGRFGP